MQYQPDSEIRLLVQIFSNLSKMGILKLPFQNALVLLRYIPFIPKPYYKPALLFPELTPADLNAHPLHLLQFFLVLSTLICN